MPYPMVDRYEAEWLGLTDREAHLLLAACNGCVMHHVGDNLITAADARGLLVGSMADAGTGATEDRAAFGRTLDQPENDSADVPFEYNDLAEKLAHLSDMDALALIWWITGFWNGIRIAQEQSQED